MYKLSNGKVDFIMRFKKKLDWIIGMTVALTILMFCGLASTAAYAAPKSKKETPKVHTNINTTKYSKNKHFETMDGGDYFSYGRIDVVDHKGYACQAMVYICKGSDRYVKGFNTEVKKLSKTYSSNQNQIVGYLDLIYNNSLRNYSDANFSAIKKVKLTNAKGLQYDAYVVAICGSDKFEKSYKTFQRNVMNEYKKTSTNK